MADFLPAVEVPGFHGAGSISTPERLPMGAEAHAPDKAGVPLEGPGLLADGRDPHLHYPVLASAGQALVVGAEGHAAGSPFDAQHLLAGGRVPHLHRLILAGA